MRKDLRGKFIVAFAVPVLIFMAAAPVDAKNIFKIGRDIIISEDQQVDSAVTVGGQITVSGLVESNIVSIGGSVVLTSEAVVRGNVVCVGGVVVQGNGAQVYGNITEVNSSNFLAAVSSAFYDETQEWSWLTDIIYFSFFAMLFTLALMMSFLFPRPLNAIICSIEGDKTKSFFWGFFGTLMIAPFFILLALSFIGIPLIPLAFSIVLLAFMFGFIAASALLGKFILKKSFRHHQQSLTQEILIGLVLWWTIGWAPFYMGMIIKAVVITIGFGGVLLTVFGRGCNRKRPAV
jgi:hypothetical protein